MILDLNTLTRITGQLTYIDSVIYIWIISLVMASNAMKVYIISQEHAVSWAVLSNAIMG